ncbi:MAG TPA: cytochrome P450 [Allosphingosinicella sp.]|nr:cytochrome P450 [Allosphingosinicella sp.]
MSTLAAQLTSAAPLKPAAPSPAARWTFERADVDGLPRTTGSDVAHIPGKLGLPFVGIVPEALIDPLRFAERMYERYGPVYRFYGRGNWNVQLIGAEANELVLFDKAGSFSAYGGWGPLVEPFFPGALLVKDGQDHRASRRILGEAFRQDRLSGYQRIFAADIDQAVTGWESGPVDVYEQVKQLTLRIAASTFLGLPLDRGGGAAVRLYSHMMGALLAVVRSPWLSPVAARGFWSKARLEALMAELIQQKRACLEDDIFSRVCQLTDENGRLLSDREIVDAMIFLLAAAHDTLASAFTSVVVFLATEPRWAEWLREELATVELAEPAEAAMAPLPRQDMFFKEAIRLNAPAPIVWRRTVRDVDIYGYRIPAGTITGVNPLLTHRIPSLWERPKEFDPLRFSPEAEAARHKFAFVPFGGGIHKCLGLHFSMQQARIFMTRLLRCRSIEIETRAGVSWYNWPNCRPRGRVTGRFTAAPRKK